MLVVSENYIPETTNIYPVMLKLTKCKHAIMFNYELNNGVYKLTSSQSI